MLTLYVIKAFFDNCEKLNTPNKLWEATNKCYIDIYEQR